MSKTQFVPTSSSFMDPDVIEIPPPIHRSTRAKRKKVFSEEVICLDNDDAFDDVTILAKKVGTKKEGKALEGSSAAENKYESKKPENRTSNGKSFTGIDNFELDSELIHGICSGHYFYGDADVDKYSLLQAKFDSIDLPTGVEAPIPWFSDSFQLEESLFQKNSGSALQVNDQSVSLPSLAPLDIKKKATLSSSSFLKPVKDFIHSGRADSSSLAIGSQHATSNNWKQLSSGLFPIASQTGGSKEPFSLQPTGATNTLLQHGVEPPIWGQIHPAKNPGFYGSFIPLSSQTKPVYLPPPLTQSNFSSHYPYSFSHSETDNANITPQELEDIRKQKTPDAEEIVTKFQLFKRFDTVETFPDHHYTSGGSSKKRDTAANSSRTLPKTLSKRIQEEWRMLEKDLPDTIFVRACETRMDLLRTVIIGAEGTPYHDGLFFFDIYFPDSYPRVPPLVNYHAHGLRLNPNLYNCGKVCLSLLNTWSGNKNEKWLPAMSTMLQVLVSIQALILNKKPYFNEPGYERSSGTMNGEKLACEYNERTVLYSLKTMLYTLRNPPKHFEDFVAGHFYNRAHDILLACQAYKDGVQVGSVLKGGVQDVEEGGQSTSQSFRRDVAASANILVKQFTKLGVKDCEKFITNLNNGGNSMRKAGI